MATTREQSQRLLALGLKRETADCGMYWAEMEERWIYFMQNNKAGILCSLCEDEIPAWSLHRLLIMYRDNYSFFSLDNAYDELIDAIAIDVEKGTFKKDYLEEKV